MWIVITRRLFGSDKSSAIVILVNKYVDMLNVCGFKITALHTSLLVTNGRTRHYDKLLEMGYN